MYLSVGTCNVGGAQGCLSYIPTDSAAILHVKWIYHAHDLVVGQKYTFSFQYWQNLRMPYYDTYMVSTGNPNEYASFFYYGNPPEWLTVTVDFVATDTTRDLTFNNYPSPNTATTFSNFNLYKACAQPV